jgi:hypothetical protein
MPETQLTADELDDLCDGFARSCSPKCPPRPEQDPFRTHPPGCSGPTDVSHPCGSSTLWTEVREASRRAAGLLHRARADRGRPAAGPSDSRPLYRVLGRPSSGRGGAELWLGPPGKRSIGPRGPEPLVPSRRPTNSVAAVVPELAKRRVQRRRASRMSEPRRWLTGHLAPQPPRPLCALSMARLAQ